MKTEREIKDNLSHIEYHHSLIRDLYQKGKYDGLKWVLEDGECSEPKIYRENIRGKWQTVAIGGITNGIRCTACKQTTVVLADRTRKMNFCPECGADMRVVKE